VLVRRAYPSVQLLLGLVFIAAVLAFGIVVEDVFGGGDLLAFDLAVARALREQPSPAMEQFLTAVSWLGGREALAAATVAVAIRLWLTHGVVLAAGWIAAQAGGGLLNLALKESFERGRPEFAGSVLAASSWSFPSAHTMGTFILCGLGAYILLREVRRPAAAGMIVGLLLLWCALMAFSRLYLGVHYASDVVAGLIAGAAWVAVCASGFEMIRRRDRLAAR
jgi:membrane-associated phospholipid phosphatase